MFRTFGVKRHRAAVVVIIGLSLSLASSPAAALVNTERHRTFADALASSLYSNPNECSSALGVSMAFSLIYPACTGAAVAEVRDTLGYPSDSDNLQMVWEDKAQRMLAASAGQCAGTVYEGVCDSEAPLLKIANSVWFDERNELNPEYAAVVGSFAKQIDLSASDSPQIVNEWVKESTNGLVETIVDPSRPIYPPHELVAINSIYLKASWEHPFQDYKTNLDSFYDSPLRNAEVSKAHFMNRVFAGLSYSHEALPGYQVVSLPFAASSMSMVFVLPTSDGSAAPVTSTELMPALNNLQSTRVALSVPKFRFESEYEDDLKAAIMQTGIKAPFSGGSLGGLFEGDDGSSLFVDKVIQKTVIDVHEAGVEAAAATAVMVGRSGPATMLDDPVLMVCDHPFQFFVYDESEDVVLFEGRVGAPEVPDKEPEAALLDARHDEGDFWMKGFGVKPVEAPILAKAKDAEVGTKGSVDSSSSPTSSAIRGFRGAKKIFSLIVGAILGFALGLLL